MIGVLLAVLAELTELETILDRLFVLSREVVGMLTLGALHLDHVVL